MLNLLRFFVTVVTIAGLGSSSFGYIVIDNFDAGADALDAVTTGVDPGKDRATGVVASDHSGKISTDKELLFPTADSGSSGNDANDRRSERTMLRYMSADNSGGSRGGGSGGGSGGSRGRRPTTRPDMPDTGFDPTIMTVKDPEVPTASSDADIDMNVTSFDSGMTGSGAGLSGDPTVVLNEDGPEEEKEEEDKGTDGPVAGSPVSGTPEPAALAVWALTGCCGYGFLRFSRKRFPSK